MRKTVFGLNVSIQIMHDPINNTKYAVIHAPMYNRKQWSPTFCWSDKFTDAEIFMDDDLNKVLMEAYGVI